VVFLYHDRIIRGEICFANKPLFGDLGYSNYKDVDYAAGLIIKPRIPVSIVALREIAFFLDYNPSPILTRKTATLSIEEDHVN
jgi:hypothetical protein